MKIAIISHNDLDGHCSAAIAYRALKAENEVFLFEMDYDRELPELPEGLNQIYVLDVSFRDNTFQKLVDLVGRDNLIWIDHHESVIRSMPQWSYLKGVRTEEWSGTMLTWKWFHGEKEPPHVVKLVDDYDRWQLKYDETLYFFEWSIGYGLENVRCQKWDMLFDMTKEDLLNKTMSIGVSLYHRRVDELKKYIKKSGISMKVIIDGKEYSCLKINSSYTDSVSLMGYIVYHEMLYDIFWSWYDKVDNKGRLTRTNQLRSIVVDVSVVAEKKGGGGHINAAGWHENIKEKFDYVEII